MQTSGGENASNVVFVQFSKAPPSAPNTLEDYMNKVEEVLCEDDYQDFLEGLTSVTHYQTLDSDLKDLVDGAYALRN